MPTTTRRPSMTGLSDIWTNPYGGAPQNEINDSVAALETAGGRDARVLYEQDFRNRQLERMALENRKLDPMRSVMDETAVTDYRVGRWNSPQGYNAEQAANEQAVSDWTRKAPERQYQMELSDLRSPYGQASRDREAQKHEYNVAIKELMNSGAMDMLDAKSRNELWSRIIMGQFSAQNAFTNQMGGVWRAGVSTGAVDPQTAARGFSNDAANAPKLPWSKIVEYSQQYRIPLNQVIADAERDYEIVDDSTPAPRVR